MTHLTPAEFGAAFDEMFTRSAFRLELLNRYVAANEAEPFRRFRAGFPQDPAWREPWKQYVRDAIRDGKQMARVHVVSEPLSDYLEFELTCGYPANVAAGEDVRILRQQKWLNQHIPRRDYWLFDSRDVAVMVYEGDGNFMGADVISDPAAVTSFARASVRLMGYSVPLNDYLASLGMKEAG